MEKHNLYYVPVCSINNLSEQMTTVLIRKMERRKVWGEIHSALLIQNSRGLLSIQPTPSKGSLRGESKWELAEGSCPHWLDTSMLKNTEQSSTEISLEAPESLQAAPEQAAGGEGGMRVPGRFGAGRKGQKWARNCPKLQCRAGME